jgi:hypothetical protein
VISTVPVVVEGQRDRLVGRVRQVLNVTGDDVLDRPLIELVRGVQVANRMPGHGLLDEATLSLFGITVY